MLLILSKTPSLIVTILALTDTKRCFQESDSVQKPIRSSELHRSCTRRTLGSAFFKRDLLMAADHRADLGSDLYQHCPPSKELSAGFENLAH